MGKSNAGTEQIIMKHFGKLFTDLVDDLPIYVLLKLGRRVCSSDYAVKYYYNKKHKMFHCKKKVLRKAIRRAWGIGAFEHRFDIIRELEWHFKLSHIPVGDEAEDLISMVFFDCPC